MFEDTENPALVELLGTISDRRIQRKVMKLVGFGAEAVRSLGELDSALYSREGGEDELQVISDAVLSHLRRLLAYLKSIAPPKETDDSADHGFDIEFASGDSLDVSDVAAAVQQKLKEQAAAGSPEPAATDTDEGKWQALQAEADSMRYGLSSELREYDRRFAEALAHDRKGQALHDLSDATNSLTDGVFAMLTTVYETFLGHADPDRMIPGYRDTLGKALVVRRNLTELRQEVQEINKTVQDPESTPLVVEMSYKLLCESLVRFTSDPEFAFLRAGDREELAAFRERFLEGDASQNRLVCEGFDKYLDSLSMVSQRDVLQKHDADLREELFAQLDAAIVLADTEPQRVPEYIAICFTRAKRLFGLMEKLDSLLFSWSTLTEEKRSDPETALEMGRLLKDLVELPKKEAPPPLDGDFL